MPPHSYADTPVMRQYQEVKERYPDCIVFFRLGDFYEMFYEDAVWASQALDLTLTSRDKGKEDGVPMCGVPQHSAKLYIGKVVSLGRKVALCEQVEDAKLARKIVRRAVTQVITPGVVLDEEQLQPKVSNFLAALRCGEGPATGHAGLALLDVTTGEFQATQGGLEAVLEELQRAEPAELLLLGEEGAAPDALTRLLARLRVPVGRSALATEGADREALDAVLGAALADLDGESASPRLSQWPLAAAAAAACVRYARGTQPGGTLPLHRLRLFRLDDTLVIDAATRDNLELFQTLMERKAKGALFSFIAPTRTAMGGRLLRSWLGAPLRAVAAITERHDAVDWLLARHRLRVELRRELSEIHDLSRLTGRVALGVASPRDLSCLRLSLEALPRLVAALREAVNEGEAPDLPFAATPGVPGLLSLGEELCGEVVSAIAAAIVDDPPPNWREGGFLRRGVSAELDELSDIAKGGKDSMLRIEERERERSGISSLKIRYNRVFGYYFEITRSNLQRVPADFIRKQTLANAERFITPELQEYEAKVLGAEERLLQLSLELFEGLVKAVAQHAGRLLELGERVARLDALCGLAELAHENGYTRPHMDDSGRLEIEDGRHPVVERLLPAGQFVPNDALLDPEGEQLLIITGPNMAGKSTVMRQVALLCILAQMGSFVPARRARVGVVDRVFTRVGASDNLARGESTFMVEMRETANILQNASRRSLVVLDEIGRGTSTYDGVSIAWAVAEHLHDVIGCKTLFATHYHELCALADSRPRVRNLSVAVREYDGDVVFLHKLVAGGASRSYGIEVAKLAGLPRSVVARSREILQALEQGATEGGGKEAKEERGRPGHGALPTAETPQLGLFQGMGQALGESMGALPGRKRRAATGRAEVERGERPERGVADHGAPLPNLGATVAALGPAPVVDPREAERSAAVNEVLRRLRTTDADGMTPRDALAMVAQLTEQLRRSAG